MKPLSRFITFCNVVGLVLASIHVTHADSATWSLNPTSSDWNIAVNWTPATVPNGPADVAMFAVSNNIGVSVSISTEVESIAFNPGASAFTITVNTASQLTISGAGVINSSGITQNFVTTAIPNGYINFTGDATAGSSTRFTNMGGNSTGNGVLFKNNSSAASATFVNNGGTDRDHIQAGSTTFFDNATAANATFINNPGKAAFGGSVVFFGNSTAANGTFLCNGGSKFHSFGGQVYFAENSTAADGVFTCSGTDSAGVLGGVVTFRDDSSAGNATLVANGGPVAGGQINFDSFGAANGGTASVAVFDNGNLDISRAYAAAGITIGSLEGNGLVFLGAHPLAIGSNGQSKTFTGVIQDGGNVGGTGGSLTKIGSGSLNLSGANTYSGGTTLSGGTLLVTNTSGSGLGTGPVQALSGILGGTGIISGRVTMGTGRGPGVTLGPGANSVTPGTLTIGKQLALKSDAIYLVTVKSSTPVADQVIANGIRIIGAQIIFNEVSSAALPPGTVLTLIGNTSSKPVSGTFANLPDGGTVTIGNNTFQANYEGGDGNDLTLTVL